MAKAPENVRRKTKLLIDEGDDPRQAYAIAWSMKRHKRLGKHGEYRRKKRRAKRS